MVYPAMGVLLAKNSLEAAETNGIKNYHKYNMHKGWVERLI